VVVRFRFIPKLNQKKFSKPWLDVRPPFGMVRHTAYVIAQASERPENNTNTTAVP
jgi:uncharacterized protein YbcC (UPF0753/DUF2309 family)